MWADTWAFLTSSDNRVILSWVGSGVVVVAGGFWAVFRFFVSKTSVAGGRGGNASVKGNVSEATGGRGGGAISGTGGAGGNATVKGNNSKATGGDGGAG
jgi:hypothetical protein